MAGVCGRRLHTWSQFGINCNNFVQPTVVMSGIAENVFYLFYCNCYYLVLGQNVLAMCMGADPIFVLFRVRVVYKMGELMNIHDVLAGRWLE